MPDKESQPNVAARRPPPEPIPGTGFGIRGESFREHTEQSKEAANQAIGDREYAARTIHRVLVGPEPVPSLEDVEAWSDEALLAAAVAYVRRGPDATDADGVASLTGFRQHMMERDRAIFDKLKPSIASTIKSIQDLGGIPVASALSDMVKSQAVLARIPLEMDGPEMLVTAWQSPEARLLDELVADQARFAEDQLNAMTEQTTLIRDQGVALKRLRDDVDGQKWQRRVSLAGIVIAAVAVVWTLLYVAGVLPPPQS